MLICIERKNDAMSQIIADSITRASSYLGVTTAIWNSLVTPPFDVMEKMKPDIILHYGFQFSGNFINIAKQKNIQLIDFSKNSAMSDPFVFSNQSLPKNVDLVSVTEPIIHSDEDVSLIQAYQCLGFLKPFRAFSINARNNISGFRYYGPVSINKAAEIVNQAEAVLCTSWWQYHNYSLANEKCIFQKNLGAENPRKKALNNSNLVFINSVTGGLFKREVEEFINERI